MLWSVVLEKTVESPSDCKEIKQVNPKGNLSWIFFGMTDAEAETPVLWPCGVKNWLIGKDPDAGKDWWWDDRMRWLDGNTISMDMRLSKLRELVMDSEAWHAAAHASQRVRCDRTTELKWIETILFLSKFCVSLDSKWFYYFVSLKSCKPLLWSVFMALNNSLFPLLFRNISFWIQAF